MKNIKSLLGSRIREIRKAKKLTQEKIAEAAGIEIPSLSNIENGKNYPNAENIEKIAHALGVEVFELYIFEHLKEPNEKLMLNEINTILKNNTNLIKIIYNIITSLKNTLCQIPSE